MGGSERGISAPQTVCTDSVEPVTCRRGSPGARFHFAVLHLGVCMECAINAGDGILSRSFQHVCYVFVKLVLIENRFGPLDSETIRSSPAFDCIFGLTRLRHAPMS
jgi:hypothetical protein